MIGNRIKGLRFLLGVADTILSFLLFWAGYFVTFGILGREPALSSSYWKCSVIATAVVAILSLRKSTERVTMLSLAMRRELLDSFRTSLAVLFALLAFLVFSKDAGTISRVFLGIYVASLSVVLVLSARILPLWLSPLVFHHQHRCGTLVLGIGAHARAFAHWIQSRRAFGLDLIGMVGPEEPGSQVEDIPFLGGYSELEEILRSTRASMLVVAEKLWPDEEMNSLKQLCERNGTRIVFPARVLTGVDEMLTVTQDEGIQLLSFRQEPLENPLNRLRKRAFDSLVALPVVVFVLPPLCLLVWIYQRLQSPGPLFFRQERVGRGNRAFLIFKFRTMHVANPDESKQASRNDSRIYPAGRWFRKLSIDEFPQFINVLRGEMSVVGPRPHLAAHDERFAGVAQNYKVRNLIKPGITGLAQVRGHRGETLCDADVLNRTDSDLFYLENWSLGLDFVIVLRTFFHIFRAPPSAY